MPDVYTRVQASSKTNTLGLSTMFLGVALHHGRLDSAVQAGAVIVFAILSVPIAAHMIARAAYDAGLPPAPGGQSDELRGERD